MRQKGLSIPRLKNDEGKRGDDNVNVSDLNSFEKNIQRFKLDVGEITSVILAYSTM